MANAFAASVVIVNVLCNFQLVEAWRGEPSSATEQAVAESSRALVQLMPEVFDRRAGADAGPVEVFCDPTVDYLPIRRLDSEHRVVVRSLFPLLYLRAEVAQNKFMSAFRPAYILLSDRYLTQLTSDKQIGPRFLAVVRDDYVPIGHSFVAGVGVDFYRRNAEAAR